MGGQLPEKICSSCYHNCKVWHSFRAMCHENHQHLFLITTAPIESVEDLSSLEIKAERIIEGANVVESAPEPVQVEVHPMVQLPATPTTIESRKQPPVVDPATPTKSTGKTNGVWDCPVCKTKLSPCVRLRDHLKVHLSEDVSELDLFYFQSVIDIPPCRIHVARSASKSSLAPPKSTPTSCLHTWRKAVQRRRRLKMN